MKNNSQNLTNTHVALLKLFSGFQRTYFKNYSRPPQKVILEKLLKYHKVKISLRTLNRRLKELREWGYLWKIVRHIRGPGIKMVCRATAYYLLEKTRKYFLGLKRAAERIVVCFRSAKFGNRFVFKKEQDLNRPVSDVEILWNSPLKIRLKPSEATY